MNKQNCCIWCEEESGLTMHLHYTPVHRAEAAHDRLSLHWNIMFGGYKSEYMAGDMLVIGKSFQLLALPKSVRIICTCLRKNFSDLLPLG